MFGWLRNAPPDARVCVESRDPAFVACCWYLRQLDPGCDAVAHVVHARDPRRRRVLMLADGEGCAWLDTGALKYRVHVGDALPGDPKPETFRRLHLLGPDRDIETFMKDALDRYSSYSGSLDDEHGSVNYWTWTDEMWCKSRKRRPRPLSTLFLPASASDLVSDFREFCSTASLERYRDLHVAPTRLYMLHGVPGSGKTSLVHCVASETGHGVACVTFGPDTTDADLRAALSTVPEGCVVCIEDVDGLFAGDGRRMAAGGVTFSGLLGALDDCGREGTATGVFLTTNKLGGLDPALRRRFDYVLEFGPATEGQARRLFQHFFPDAHGEFGDFWDRVGHRRVSMSVLQKVFLKGRPREDLHLFEALAACADAGVSRDMYS